MKHDGCRIVQGCLKYGNADHRKKILDAFINKNIAEFAKGKYSHFLVIKMLEYIDKAQYAKIVDYLFKSFDTVAVVHVNFPFSPLIP